MIDKCIQGTILTNLIMGIMAGIGGIVIGSTFQVGNPTMADSFLFPAIISTFLGAVFLREGIPNIIGTIIAALLFAIISNGMTMIGSPLWIKELLQGVILILAVAIVSALKPGGIPGVKMG